jgi:nucleotide-binding universal stress UspA family protein
MGQLAWSLCGQVEAQTAVQEGLPWEEIVERSRDFDLVLMGGSRGRKRWNLFSKHTARRVLENAACPVLVVHDED